jgi:hypothetical protein
MGHVLDLGWGAGNPPIAAEVRTADEVAGADKRLAIGLIMSGALFRILSFVLSDNSGGDANAHLELAASWLRHPTLKFIFDTYPPGHFWLIGLSSLVVPDVVAAGRLLSLVLGIASIVVCWRLASLLYGPSAGLLSLAVCSFYTLYIGYSSTSSAEISYVFFFLLAAYFFFDYLKASPAKLWYLAVSGTMLSVAESIRYEAWVLFAGLGLILLIFSLRQKRSQGWWKSLRPLLIFGLTAGAWPAVMTAYSWHAFGNPTQVTRLNPMRFVAAMQTSLAYQLALTPGVLLISLSPFAVIGAIYGLTKSFSSRLTAAFAALTIFFGAIQMYWFVNRSLIVTARYTLTLGTMLAIISGFGLQKIMERFPARIAAARFALIALLVLNLTTVLVLAEVPNRYADKFASVSPRPRYAARIKAVGDYLRSHMGPDDAIVIDDHNVESDIVASAAGLPLVAGKRVYLASKKYPGTTVRDYISEEHPRFLVYADRGILRRSIALPSGCRSPQEVAGVEFHCVFETDVYRVYTLTYQ